MCNIAWIQGSSSDNVKSDAFLGVGIVLALNQHPIINLLQHNLSHAGATSPSFTNETRGRCTKHSWTAAQPQGLSGEAVSLLPRKTTDGASARQSQLHAAVATS